MAFNIKYVYDLVDNISPKLKKVQSSVKQAETTVRNSAMKMGRSFDNMKHKLDGVGKKATEVGKSLFLKLTVPIGVFGGMAIKAASDFEESMNKVDVAFGDSAKSVKDFAQTAGEDFGIDRGSALDMAAMFGDMATGMGLTQDQASKMATSLVGLSGDMSSFKNESIEVMKTALASVFTGETESLKKLGTVMTETNLKEFARSRGIRKSLKDMKQAEKVLLRYQFVLESNKNSLGDYKRTQEGFANQLRGLGTAWKDLSIILGTIMLPLATKMVAKLKTWVEAFNRLNPTTQKIILVVAGLAAALSPLLIAIGLMIPGIIGVGKALVVVIGLFKTLAVLAVANPFGLFLAGLAATGALIALNWQRVTDIFQSVFNWIGKIANSGLNKLMEGIGSIAGKFGFGGGEINQNLNTNINQRQNPINVNTSGSMRIEMQGAPQGTRASVIPDQGSALGQGSIFIGRGG